MYFKACLYPTFSHQLICKLILVMYSHIEMLKLYIYYLICVFHIYLALMWFLFRLTAPDYATARGLQMGQGQYGVTSARQER